MEVSALRGCFVGIDGSASMTADPARRARCHAMVRALTRDLLEAGGGVVTLVGADDRGVEDDPDTAITFIWTMLEEVDTFLERTPSLSPDRLVARVVLSPKSPNARIPDHRRDLWERLRSSGHVVQHAIEETGYFGVRIRERQCELGDAQVIVSGGKGVVHLSALYRAAGKPVVPIEVEVGSSRSDGPGGSAIYREALVYPERFVSAGAEDLRRTLPQLSLERDDAASAAVARRALDLIARVRSLRPTVDEPSIVSLAQPPTFLKISAEVETALDWGRFVEEARVLLPGLVRTGDENAASARLRVGGFDRDVLIRAAEADMFKDFVRAAGGRHLRELCADEQCLYELLPEVKAPSAPRQRDVTDAELRLHLKGTHVLVVTTTPTEREALMASLQPLPGTDAILRGARGELTVRVGRLGRHRVAYVECAMGSLDRRGSALTVMDAVSKLKPKTVLVVGIAFGASRGKQRFGDVLVADAIAPYELAKVTSSATTPRAPQLRAGATLTERFATRSDDWRYARLTGDAKVHVGLVLSGEKVVDAVEFREALKRDHPTALGGEMEGAGAYSAASRKGVEVLLLKAVCDFADGHKNDRAQPFAARAAVSLAEHVLNKPDVLKHLGVVDCVP